MSIEESRFSYGACHECGELLLEEEAEDGVCENCNEETLNSMDRF